MSSSRLVTAAVGSGQLLPPLQDHVSGALDLLLYYGFIGLGTRRRMLTVDVDTGSAQLRGQAYGVED